MREVLAVLAREDRPMTGNEIGLAVNAKTIRGGRGQGGRGRGARTFGPAQQVIPVLTALRKRGLTTHAARPDGMSGTADRITDEGRAWLRENPR
jgi:hypothetical protein